MSPALTVAWHLQLVLVGLSVGLIATCLPKAIPLSRSARFVAGVCLAPSIVALTTIVFAHLVPRSPLRLFAFVPLLVIVPAALASFHFLRPSASLASPGRLVGIRPGSLQITLLGLFAMAGVGSVLYFAGHVFAHNFVRTPSGGDATQYLAQAFHFASHRDGWRIIGGAGLADGSLRGDLHGPFWTAYLASAIAATGARPNGANLAAPGAIIATVPLLLLSLALLFQRVRGVSPTLLTIILLFSIPGLGYMVSSHSRDAFRLIPLLCLIALFVGCCASPIHSARRILPVAASFAAAAFFTAGGHSLAIFLVPLTALGGCAALLLSRTQGRYRFGQRFRLGLCLGIATGLGAVVGFGHLIVNLVRTGSLSAGNVTSDEVLAGTPYAPLLKLYNDKRVISEDLLHNPILTLFTRDLGPVQQILAYCGFSVAIICVVLALVRFIRRRPSSPVAMILICLSLILIMQSVLFSGWLDFGGHAVSQWLAMNSRYTLQTYVLLSAICALVATTAYARLSGRDIAAPGAPGERQVPALPIRLAAGAAAAVLVVALSLQAKANIGRTFFPIYTPGLRDPIVAFEQKLSGYGEDCRYLSEVDQLSYHWARPRLMIFSAVNRELFLLKTAEEIDRYLQRNNICAIAVYSNFIMASMPTGYPFKDYLSDPDYIINGTDPSSYLWLFVRRKALRES
ncbi:hypothetical protein DK26_20670 [Bosea sp. WAO]|uniref:hypothetical protein n=1 Tax=Bosea sp. WAO TaxID=406341 RepID=UPI000748C89C|nr:hypothetical protein [Bosea sp. WAO]KUL94108.1 hypothetical protein DK26_20670 [Bosea sp. WAO]